MDHGTLSTYFQGVAAKRLAPVDVDAQRSNQHEFNGVNKLKALFGAEDIMHMSAVFAYLSDEAEAVFDHGFTSWYDARRRHPTRSESRLYYSDNAAMELTRPGDLMIVALSQDQELLILFTKECSTIESQVRWLFGLDEEVERSYSVVTDGDERIGALAARILELVGIEVRIPDAADSYLDGLISRFGINFPKGKEFSAYSMETLGDLDWQNDPDGSLVACYEREELLFRIFERYILERDLAPCMQPPLDVDGVLRITMSAFQRRKSRAGSAFENQLAALFDARGISYSAQAYTEGKSKPDFVFPSIECYRDPSFPTIRLTMLGAKTTIKERWRQVLDEADRIHNKHLVTLEPAVSEDYTRAMAKDHLTLVVPQPLFQTFTDAQQGQLMSVADFCSLVEARQNPK